MDKPLHFIKNTHVSVLLIDSSLEGNTIPDKLVNKLQRGGVGAGFHCKQVGDTPDSTCLNQLILAFYTLCVCACICLCTHQLYCVI